jgi:hypothetical protein
MDRKVCSGFLRTRRRIGRRTDQGHIRDGRRAAANSKERTGAVGCGLWAIPGGCRKFLRAADAFYARRRLAPAFACRCVWSGMRLEGRGDARCRAKVRFHYPEYEFQPRQRTPLYDTRKHPQNMGGRIC